MPLNLVPVDYVAGAIVRLAFDRRAIGLTFHLTVDPAHLPQAREVLRAARNWAAMYLKERRTMDLRWNGKVVLAPPPAPESGTPASGKEAVAPGPGEGGPTHG